MPGIKSESVPLIEDGAIRIHGERIPLLSGEVQFFRMDPSSWEGALDNLQAAGIPIVSTYLGWRRFSIAPGRYDLEGRTDPRLDVRRFLDMCSSRGLWVTMKPGPWICAEEANGGYPDWLVQEEELQVRDSEGRAVLGYSYPFQSPIPSYHHPAYLSRVKEWLAAVDGALADYFFPRGPIILVQLDNEPCMTFHDKVFESDYNPFNLELFKRRLEERYPSIDALNAAHGSAYSSFAEFEPPRSLLISRIEGLAPYFDWIEFKEASLASHVAKIGKMHVDNKVDGVLFTINYNEHPQLAVPNDWSALEASSGMGGFDYYPRMPVSDPGLRDLALFVNYSRICNRLPWSPEIMSGSWTFEGNEYAPGSLKPSDFEFLYLACMAYGLKGMNFYMFADRDNWVESPLSSEGEPGPNIDSIRKVVRLISGEADFERLDRSQDVAVLYYRPYAREGFLASASSEPVEAEGYRLGDAYRGFAEAFGALHDLNLDPALVDPWISKESFKKHKVIVVPGGAYMDEACLDALASYVEGGGLVFWLGETARYDLNFRPLAREFGPLGGLGRLIRLPGASLGKQELIKALAEAGIAPAVAADDEGLRTVLHRYEGKAWLFVINRGEALRETVLRFRDPEYAKMVSLVEPGLSREIIGGAAKLRCCPHSVQVWALHAQ